VLLIHLVSPVLLPLILLTFSGGVSAIGLGELRGQPALGDRLRLEIELLGAEKLVLDPACFRLVQPSGAGDIPWLKQANFSIRKATKPVLQIRSEVPLREPILQLAIEVGCGHDVARDYMVLASPEKFDLSPPTVRVPVAQNAVAEVGDFAQPKTPKSRPALPESQVIAPKLAQQPKAKRTASPRQSDRILLSGGMAVGEPTLRLESELSSLGLLSEAKEAQRDILRLEYRMLAALHEQVTTQMATAEKLRNMEATLSELQQRTSEFAQRVEPSPISPPVARVELPVAPAPDIKAPVIQNSAPISPKDDSFALSEWSIYGVLLGGLLGVGAWLGWRRYRERQAWLAEDEAFSEMPELAIDAKRNDEREEPGGVDLAVEPSEMGSPMQVDLELDGGDADFVERPAEPNERSSRAHDSLMSISATTVDEHFEANPVMELADIMLSFGRVKGAAQALQEYIDNSPQEALQPWIRLLEVYRMAEMRHEFESLATNLNQNFNVAIPSWEPEQVKLGEQGVDLVLDDTAAAPVAALPQSIEDMPRIISTVCNLWAEGDIVSYLQQLLRDNRGGKRAGFTLPVVEEILFLVELKECANRLDL
jgi:predicted negative regulator of RcsB-dependent stress response